MIAGILNEKETLKAAKRQTSARTFMGKPLNILSYLRHNDSFMGIHPL
jgi:hypothetical protein